MTPAQQQAVERLTDLAACEPPILDDEIVADLRALLSLVASPAPAVEVRGVVTGRVVRWTQYEFVVLYDGAVDGSIVGQPVTVAITPGGMPGEE